VTYIYDTTSTNFQTILNTVICCTSTTAPSRTPSSTPTRTPSNEPSRTPSVIPTAQPSVGPTTQPSDVPSTQPTDVPSDRPTLSLPSPYPTAVPTALPTEIPTTVPSRTPSGSPSTLPSWSPSTLPTDLPSQTPSRTPSSCPSVEPSALPTKAPTTCFAKIDFVQNGCETSLKEIQANTNALAQLVVNQASQERSCVQFIEDRNTLQELIDATSASPWERAVSEGGLECSVVPLEACADAGLTSCRLENNVCVFTVTTKEPSATPSLAPSKDPTPCLETVEFWEDAVVYGDLSCNYVPPEICDDVTSCAAHEGQCYDQESLSCDNLCNGRGTHADNFSPDGCTGVCTCTDQAWTGDLCDTRVEPTILNLNVPSANPGTSAEVTFQVDYPNPGGVFHIVFVRSGDSYDANDIFSGPIPSICNSIVYLPQTSSVVQTADCLESGSGDVLNVYLYSQADTSSGNIENYVLKASHTYTFTVTQGCYNSQCGCPPYTNGEAWCDDSNSAVIGSNGICNESQDNCENSCSNTWCSNPHDMVGQWRDLTNTLYGGAVITINEASWSVAQNVNTLYGFEWDVEPTVLKLSDAAASEEYTVQVATSTTLTFVHTNGNSFTVTRVFTGSVTLEGSLAGVDTNQFLQECSDALQTADCISATEGSINIVLQANSEGELTIAVEEVDNNGLVTASLGTFYTTADCGECSAALTASTHGCAQHILGVEITDMPESCAGDRYASCKADIDPLCETAKCVHCVPEFSATEALCQEYRLGISPLNADLMPDSCEYALSLCEEEIGSSCYNAWCAPCVDPVVASDTGCIDFTNFGSNVDLYTSAVPQECGSGLTIADCSSELTTICTEQNCTNCKTDFINSEGNALCNELLNGLTFSVGIPASCMAISSTECGISELRASCEEAATSQG